MKQNAASRQPDLFDVDDYQTSPIPSQKEQLAALVEALLRHPNDRLLLGMKGTTSELELSLFRQRSQEAL